MSKMYLENQKRKSTVVYITYGCILGVIGYLGIVRHWQIFTILFFVWLLLAFILISKYGCQRLIKLKLEKKLAIEMEREYKTPAGKSFIFLLIIALPFYYAWFWISIFASMNGYVFVMLNIPSLVLSFLAFGQVFFVWCALEVNRFAFWGLHVGTYVLIQLLGWAVRAVWLDF